MGEIIGSKIRNDGKVVFNIALTHEEALQLQGHINNIRVFSENAVTTAANLSQRGANGATKYFLVPTQLRKDLFIRNEVSCQRLDTSTKTIFVYVIDKLKI